MKIPALALLLALALCVLRTGLDEHTTLQPASTPAGKGISPPPAHFVDNPFNRQVHKWAYDLRKTAVPKGNVGNCVPVAVALQGRIVKSGRMAFIIITDPTPDDDISHALVEYDSDLDGRVDSVIDNGYTTNFYPGPVSGIREGLYGKFVGYCHSPLPNGYCYTSPYP